MSRVCRLINRLVLIGSERPGPSLHEGLDDGLFARTNRIDSVDSLHQYVCGLPTRGQAVHCCATPGEWRSGRACVSCNIATSHDTPKLIFSVTLQPSFFIHLTFTLCASPVAQPTRLDRSKSLFYSSLSFGRVLAASLRPSWLRWTLFRPGIILLTSQTTFTLRARSSALPDQHNCQQ